MSHSAYPFPRRDEAVRTLERDYVYAKIPPADIPAMVDDAWRVGEDAARAFLARRGGGDLDFVRVMREDGLTVRTLDEDFVSGGVRYFADYLPRRRLVTLYRQSVAKWGEANGFTYEQAVNLILMHEYFHYLEYSELGPVSRRHLVPMLQWGGLRLGRTGIPSLSEIAADAFAGVVYEHTTIRSAEEVMTIQAG